MDDKAQYFPTEKTGNTWPPQALAAEEQAIERTLLAGYQDALRLKGCSEERLAKERMAELRATAIKHLKIKGHLPAQLKLPRGYKVITPTERMVITDPDSGTELVVDPGETIIEYRGPDWPIRDRAMTAIETIMGYRTEQQAGGNGRTVIVVQSLMPQPAPPPSPEALALVHCMDPEGSSSAGGNGNDSGGNGNGGGPK